MAQFLTGIQGQGIYDYSFANQFGQKLRASAFADMASEMPTIERSSPNLLEEFNAMARELQSEIKPYLTDKLCPKLLINIDQQLTRILDPEYGLTGSVREKLRGPSFDYFFKPMPVPFEYHRKVFWPSLFMADALTLLQNINEKKEETEAIRRGQYPLPNLSDTQLVVNNKVITSANVYDPQSESYQSAIFGEEELTDQVLIQDKDEAVITSLTSFNGIERSTLARSHPITRTPLSECTVSILVPISNQPRSFMGIEVSIELLSHLDALVAPVKNVADESWFIPLKTTDTVQEEYCDCAKRWMGGATEMDTYYYDALQRKNKLNEGFDRELRALTYSTSIWFKLSTIQSEDELQKQIADDLKNQTRDSDHLQVCLVEYLKLLHIKNAGLCLLDVSLELVPNSLWDLFQKLKQYNA